ncbi:MAG: hypothetical protein AAB476_00780 [Patescibacteria group bacterium]
METIVVAGVIGIMVCAVVVFVFPHCKKSLAGSQPIYVGNMPVAKATEPRWQVRFAGDWFACSPPLGENSPGWVQVQLADKRTHGRPIIRPAGEVRKLE